MATLLWLRMLAATLQQISSQQARRAEFDSIFLKRTLALGVEVYLRNRAMHSK
ncbi:hypothetical protein [Paenibacillus polymyxa]|uniref:hypothetical protein n=1 Tax=Paenibacillus polymyxa TaxID=1406 RepID=UPI0018671B2F|nr:hypothetical protein [Paenibacillus polymyxa]MBE3650940.1 hypothetical protein [Paenibacillus polymyxa]